MKPGSSRHTANGTVSMLSSGNDRDERELDSGLPQENASISCFQLSLHAGVNL